MNIEILKIAARELTLGMHVFKLDRPWLETPFKLQGFRIKTLHELKLLNEYCSHVYVDIELGLAPPSGTGERVTLNEDGEVVDVVRSVSALARGRERERKEQPASVALPPPATDYPITQDFRTEMAAASAAVENTKQAVQGFTHILKAGGRADLEPVRSAATALEDSLLRHPDPAMLLRMLPSGESFSFRHCVHSAILAVNIGRALGLKRQNLHELCMGSLLADIGKIRLPKELLRTQRRLDRRETDIIKLHVKFGVDIVSDLDGMTPGARDIVAGHHERFDGSGYPRGLAGAAIPMLARIAGLADSFDALTSERTYSEAVAVHEAVQELYAATVEVFQRELLDTLFQILGPHPIGCLVELNDGRVALVAALNRERRLLPWIIPLTDAGKVPHEPQALVNLAAGVGVTVKDVLATNAYGLTIPRAEQLAELFRHGVDGSR